MLNHQQLLELIRERMDHPATPRELLQRLKIPRDERPTFKRLLTDLVADGALVETRGNRYRPARPDEPRRRPHGDPSARLRVRGAGPAARGGLGRPLHRRQQPEPGHARRPGGCAHRARDRRPGRRADRAHPRPRVRHRRRPLRRGRFGHGLRRAVRPPADHGRAHSGRRDAGGGGRRHGRGRNHPMADARARSGRARHGSPRRRRRARRRHRDHHPQVRPPRRTRRGGRRRSAAARGRGARSGPARADRLPAPASRSPSTASTRATSTTRSRSSGCPTATSGSASTSRTSPTT